MVKSIVSGAKGLLQKQEAPQFKLVVYLSVSQLIGWGTLYYAFTLFIESLHNEFGWSSAEINLALTLGFISWAAAAPLIGNALDYFGGRRVMSFGSLAGIMALLLWAYATSLTVLYVSWIIMGIAMASALYEPAFFVLTKAYPHQYKKVITWLTLAGGFASTIFTPLIDFAIRYAGWNLTLIGMAALNLCVALPIHLWKLPSNQDIGRDKKNLLLDFKLFKESSFKPRTFWGLNLWFVISNSVATGVTFLFIPLFSEAGTARETLIVSFSLIGPMQVLGRFALMWIGSNYHSLKVGPVITVFASVGIGLVAMFPQSLPALILFAALFGTSKGIMTIIKGTAVVEQMDITIYARTNGWLSLCSMLFKALTPITLAMFWLLIDDPIVVFGSLGLVGLASIGGIWLIKTDSA